MSAERFLCEDCGKRFTRISNLHRHQRTTHGSELSHCQTCGKRFNRRDSYLRHLRLHSRCLGPISQQETPPISSSLQDQDNKENVNPNHPIQQGGGDPSSDIKGIV